MFWGSSWGIAIPRRSRPPVVGYAVVKGRGYETHLSHPDYTEVLASQSSRLGGKNPL